MNSNKETVHIHLLGKPYPMVCPADEAKSLKDAAHYLDQKLQTLARAHPQLPLERLALMAALDLSQECLSSSLFREDLEAKMRALNHALETELC